MRLHHVSTRAQVLAQRQRPGKTNFDIMHQTAALWRGRREERRQTAEASELQVRLRMVTEVLKPTEKDMNWAPLLPRSRSDPWKGVCGDFDTARNAQGHDIGARLSSCTSFSQIRFLQRFRILRKTWSERAALPQVASRLQAELRRCQFRNVTPIREQAAAVG